MERKRICGKCGKRKKMTRHHIFPRRWYGKGNINPETVDICRDCHDELEEIIPFEKMPEPFYRQVVEQFLTA